MKFLSNILKRAAQPSASGTAVMPYIHLQKYFQLFVGGIYTIKDNPPIDSLAIKVPGQFLQYYGSEEGDDFFSSETSFTTTGEFNNQNGGHIYHGEYVTHGKDGGAMEYIYFVMAASQPTENPAQRKFTPHFVYLGGRMPGETQEVIYSTFMLCRSGFNGENSFLTSVNQNSMTEVISAFAYADIPFKKILAGEEVNGDMIAAAFSMTDINMRVDKFYNIIDGRTPQSLSLEMNT